MEQAIAEAKSRLSLTGNKEALPAGNSQSNDSPQLQLHITLSDAILEKLSQGADKTPMLVVTNDHQVAHFKAVAKAEAK